MTSYIKYFLLTLVLVYATSFSVAQVTDVDSLISALQKMKEDTNKLKKLNDLAEQLWRTGDFQAGKKYSDDALKLAELLSLDPTSSQLLHSIKIALGSTYSNIGIIYAQQGNYPEALKYQLKVLKIREETGNKMGMAVVYGNLGAINFLLGEYEASLKYQLLSLALNKKNNNKVGIASAYGNIGNVFVKQAKYDEALENYNTALPIWKELENERGLSSVYNNIGLIMDVKGKLKESMENYEASYAIRERTGDKDGMASSFINMGRLNIKLKKYKEASIQMQKGLSISKEIGSWDALEESYSALASLDSVIGNNKGAFENFKLFILYKDSLLNDENKKRSMQVEMQYDFDKKESQAKADQSKKDVVAETTRKRQSIILGSAIAGLLLVLIFALYIYRSLIQKKKANGEIIKQKNIIEEKQKDILDSIYYAKRIQRSLLPTDKYIDKNIRRLRNK